MWPFLSAKAQQNRLQSLHLRADYIIMTSCQDWWYLNNHALDHHASHIKQNFLSSPKWHKILHTNIFIGIEMSRHQKRVIKKKHLVHAWTSPKLIWKKIYKVVILKYKDFTGKNFSNGTDYKTMKQTSNTSIWNRSKFGNSYFKQQPTNLTFNNTCALWHS